MSSGVISLAQGRCAGCGKVGASVRIEQHLTTCADYLLLFKADPEKALLPEAELERWQREDRSPEAKAAAKEIRLHGILVDQDQRRAQQETRWSRPADILAD